MDKDTALKMAIEALDTLMMEKDSVYQKAINTCKEALKQPTQDTEHKCEGCVKCDARCLPTQEPVAEVAQKTFGSGQVIWFKEYPEDGTKLYTHPYQWQGLSDDEIDAIFPLGDDVDVLDVARAVEAKLKEKNT